MGFSIPLKDVLIKNLKERYSDSLKKIVNQNYYFLDRINLKELEKNDYGVSKSNNLRWNILILAEWLNKNKSFL